MLHHEKNRVQCVNTFLCEHLRAQRPAEGAGLVALRTRTVTAMSY